MPAKWIGTLGNQIIADIRKGHKAQKQEKIKTQGPGFLVVNQREATPACFRRPVLKIK